MGICAAMTVAMSLGTALTLTPVMLLAYPTFFTSFKKGGMTCDECGCCEVPDLQWGSTGGYGNLAEGRPSQGSGAVIVMSEAQKQAEEDKYFAKSRWRLFGEGESAKEHSP